jgi:curved DNA-binding protein CbpA
LFLRRELFGVNDHFAELGLARGAWIESEDVKKKHHLLMATCHPDKSHGDSQSATRLNEARRILERPATRLRHLLELEFPNFESRDKPQPDWDLFSRTGEAARFASQVAAAQASATSPLARAVATAQASEVGRRLSTLQNELSLRAINLEQKTKSLSPGNAQSLSNLAEEWTFLNRWQSVIHEALAAL